jgi:DNA-binding YbaB/EbfC family protein
VQPGQPDMQMILQQAQKMQEQLMTAQAELASAEVTGQAGNGLVQVTMTATQELRAIRIDPKVVDPDDVETLQDLIVGAFQDAMGAAQDLAAEKMGPLAGGGGLGLPGLG